MVLRGMPCTWAFVWLLTLTTSVMLAGCGSASRELQTPPTRAYVDARSVLLVSADDPDPRVRANAVEALVVTEGRNAGAVYVQALKDDRLPVVAAGAMAVGETRYAPAQPVLVALAEGDRTPPRLLPSVIYALHRLGNDQHTGRLGRLLRDRDKHVRAEAARVMGKIGDPSAIGPLKAVQRDDMEVMVRLNVAEALAMLGDERSIGQLEAFTKSQFMEDRLIAIQALGKLRHARSLAVLRRVARNNRQGPIARVAAIGELAGYGERTNTRLACDSARDPEHVLRRFYGKNARIENKDVVTLQTLAVHSLEQMGNELAVDIIHPLLTSTRGPVKVAAARATLRLLRAYCPKPTTGVAKALTPPSADARKPATQPATQPATAPSVAAAPTPTTRPSVRPKLHSAGAKD